MGLVVQQRLNLFINQVKNLINLCSVYNKSLIVSLEIFHEINFNYQNIDCKYYYCYLFIYYDFNGMGPFLHRYAQFVLSMSYVFYII